MISNLKPYPLTKDSGVEWLGAIPEHWEVRRGKNVFDKVDVRSQTGEEELLTVSSERGVVPRSSASVTMFAAESYVGHKLCWPNDLVINSLWAWAGGLGVSRHQGIVSTAYGVYRPRKSVNPTFVHKLVRSKPFHWELQVRSKGVWTSRLQLTDDAFLCAPFPIPPLSEQAAIVRYLDHVERKVRRILRAKIKQLDLLVEQRKKATFEAVQSSTLKTLRISHVADLVQRPIDRTRDITYTPIGLYNRGRGIFKKTPAKGDELGDSDFFWVKEDDLVISGQFAWEGAIALARRAEDGCVASHRYPILRGKAGIAESGFLMSLLQTDWGQVLLDFHSRGAAGRNRPLNARTLSKEKISLPPLKEQCRIVEMLKRETRVRQQVERWNTFLREYRNRLTADVVTGKLDVREAAATLPDEEPVEPTDQLDEAIDLAAEEEDFNVLDPSQEEVEV